MEILKALESIRFPALDRIMQGFTSCGEELVFMAVALILFWCVDKWKGYYVLTVGFVGTLFSQFLKLLCRVPRPWVRDPSFTVVESAQRGATGYSFPSGHAQNAACTFGGIARACKHRALRVALVVLTLLVGFSRLYLGAHDLADVGVGLLMGLVLVFALYPLLRRAKESPCVMRGLLIVLTLLSLGNLAYLRWADFPDEVHLVDPLTGISNYDEALKNGCTLLGCLAGLIVAYTVDLRKLHFSEAAPLPGQICKVVFGMAALIGLRYGLSALFKSGLLPAFQGQHGWSALRYFLMVVFAGAVWPATFRFWARVGRRGR
ncbi:MAG: phosphatase PAP2 family protein [Oscillospiraceae bacterium]|nr:phosphatase PAP2 family protein [Oscillospiraceae bacterium]